MDAIIKNSKGVKGTIEISGSKNAALPIIASSILAKGKVILKNVPNISDVSDMINILEKLNINVMKYNHTLIIERKEKIKTNLMLNEVKKIRGSVYLLPVILNLRKKVISYYPGGCDFGKRPIDYHLMAFENLNVKVISKAPIIELKTKKLKKAEITFPKKTLGGTINAIITALFIKGETTINNPSIEPEVLDTISFLNALGGNIKLRQDKIVIKGVKKLRGTTFKIMSDRIEAASYLFLASSIKNSILTITNIDYKILKTELTILSKLGIIIKKDNNKITVINSNQTVSSNLKIIASDYPYLSTDLQQIITPLLFTLNSESTIIDEIYIDRTKHIEELKKLNGKMEIIKDDFLTIKIYPCTLKGNIINGCDLRGTFGLIIAAGISTGETRIIGIDNVFRGYDNIINKLKKINFPIETY